MGFLHSEGATGEPPCEGQTANWTSIIRDRRSVPQLTDVFTTWITGPGSDKEKFRRKCRYLRWLLLLARGLAEVLGIPVVVGGDLNLDVSKLEVKEVLGDATEGAELVKYKVNPRRKKNVVDWLYLINPRNGHTRLECKKCVAVDPAQPYRERLAEGVTLHPNWFDHDALLAVLRLVVCRQTA